MSGYSSGLSLPPLRWDLQEIDEDLVFNIFSPFLAALLCMKDDAGCVDIRFIRVQRHGTRDDFQLR